MLFSIVADGMCQGCAAAILQRDQFNEFLPFCGSSTKDFIVCHSLPAVILGPFAQSLSLFHVLNCKK